MRLPLVWFAVLAVLAASGCSTPVPAGVVPENVAVRQATPAEFAAELGGRFVVNVHVPDEGSIRGTDVAIPFDRVQVRADELPADRAAPLALYCMTGRMSAIAGETLAGLGYTDVVELRGGMQAWEAGGLPLEPARG